MRKVRTLLASIWIVAALLGSTAAPSLASTASRRPASAPSSPLVVVDRRWAGAMVTIVVGMFVLAAAVGIAVRLNTPDIDEPAADPMHDAHDPSSATDHSARH